MTNERQNPRFVPIGATTGKHADDAETRWWYDHWRPLNDQAQPYMAVQVYAQRDPNAYVPIMAEMCLLFIDQAAFYIVCAGCYDRFCADQWSGSTHGGSGWQANAEKVRQQHERLKGWCEFCDPVFGNGGRMI